MTCCGIPSITLQGTKEDWISIKSRATAALSHFELDWWLPELLPVLDHFIGTFDGMIDTKFWESIYKFENESGGPYTSGWINVFFPYLSHPSHNDPEVINYNRNTFCVFRPAKKGFANGPNPSSYPLGISRVPFDWNYLGQSFPMIFMAGFTLPLQDQKTLEITPNIGWAVQESC